MDRDSSSAQGQNSFLLLVYECVGINGTGLSDDLSGKRATLVNSNTMEPNIEVASCFVK